MTKLGIMEGRLLPPEDGRFQCFPRNQWESEFAQAAKVPFNYIEWVYDLYGHDMNPLGNRAGMERLKNLTQSSGVSIRSVCADYFMDKPFVRCGEQELDERLQELAHILRNGRAVGVNRVVIPFVDASAIRSKEDLAAVQDALKAAMPFAEETGIEIHLETSLGPAEFAKLLNCVPHPKLRVNYDSGNSASLGYSPTNEFAAYGDRIGSVHIKDRVLNGGTVPLGTGSADFPALFSCLERIEYRGDFTLQVARGTPGDEVAWAKRNLAFVRRYWNN
ncbi:MAG TPA: sugar phosphate isomerase/epimerase family protein [Terriglobales bacterium]|jgi:L-ribulose-5-phosphate 3-epimerase|nr:sugar phosphate isomerase/epimerase family protein [Terriglobales bacterium]